jgi:hypothetical protein
MWRRIKLFTLPSPSSLSGDGLKAFDEREAASLGTATPCHSENPSDFARDRLPGLRKGGTMLEETNPLYSHIAQLYVPKRTDVWPMSYRRKLPRRVTFGQRRTWSGVISPLSVNLSQRTSVVNSFPPREQNEHGRTVIRCPYCVEDGGFQAMNSPVSGEGHLCSGCEHVVFPSNPLFECDCIKCAKFKIS